MNDLVIDRSLIAQRPFYPRDHSRLLYLDKDKIEDLFFYDLVKILRSDDVLVLNDTKVIRALLTGLVDGIKIKINLIEQIEEDLWHVLVKPGRKVQNKITLISNDNLRTQEVSILKNRQEFWTMKVKITEDFLKDFGTMPIPPYLKRESDFKDLEEYQTVFAIKSGSIAAPT